MGEIEIRADWNGSGFNWDLEMTITASSEDGGTLKIRLDQDFETSSGHLDTEKLRLETVDRAIRVLQAMQPKR